jgi:GLPGLI family protein
MKTLLFILISISVAASAIAQNSKFVHSGSIEFEKRANIYAIRKKQITSENEIILLPKLEEYKQKNEQFKVSKSILYFDNNKSLYKPISDQSNDNEELFSSRNIIKTDLTSGTSLSQKKAFEELFSIKDSIRKIDWKITDEERDIAGFTCRRANAIILDSIYVVAFYTIEIPMRGGPESFTGLPGMILGVALPHDNLTWFATKVVDRVVKENELTTPITGKLTGYKDFEIIVKRSLQLMKDAAQPILVSLLL